MVSRDDGGRLEMLAKLQQEVFQVICNTFTLRKTSFVCARVGVSRWRCLEFDYSIKTGGFSGRAGSGSEEPQHSFSL